MTDSTKQQYRAFISYRHADNTEQGRQWATWLHQAIEHYEVPADLVGTKNLHGELIPERIYPVFRDEQELPAHADLGSAIVGALEKSALLVVLCSPRATESTYVAQEIDYFKSHGRSDSIIAAIIDGEPNTSWDKGKLQSGWKQSDECFPEPLLYEYDENGQSTTNHAEPIAADFRVEENGRLTEGWTTPQAYRQHLQENSSLTKDEIKKRVEAYTEQLNLMVLKIIAGVLSIPLRDLTQRDKAYQLEQEKKRSKRLRRWMTALAFLTLLATVAGVIAFYQRQEAAEQRKLAMLQRDQAAISQSYFLMEKADKSNQNGFYDQALLLGLHALPGEYGGERPLIKEQHALRTAIASSQKRIQFSHNDVQHAAYSSDGAMVATAGSDGRVIVWSATDGKKQFSFEHPKWIQSLAISGDDRVLITVSGYEVNLWSLETGEQIDFGSDYNRASKVEVSADGRYLLMSNYDGLYLYSLHEQKMLHQLNSELSSGAVHFGFSPNGEQIFATNISGSTGIWDTKTGELRHTFRSEGIVTSVRFSSDSGFLIAAMGQSATVWDLATGDVNKILQDLQGISKAAFYNKNLIVTSNLDSGLTFWSRGEGTKILQTGTHLVGTVFDFRVGHDTPLIAIKNSSEVTLLDMSQLTTTHLSHEGDINDFAIAPDGNSVLTASEDGSAALWATDNKELKHFWQHIGGLHHLAVSPDGNWIAVTENKRKTVHIYSLKEGKKRNEFKVAEKITRLRFSPDSQTLLAVSDIGTVDAWRLEDSENILRVQRYKVTDAQFISSEQIAILSGNWRDVSLDIWSVTTGDPLVYEQAYDGNFRETYLNPKANQFLGITDKGEVTAWDLQTGEKQWQWSDDSAAQQLTVSPSGEHIAVHCKNGGIFTLKAVDGRAEWLMQTTPEIRELTISNGGGYLAFWNTKGLHVWSLAEKRAVYTVDLNGEYITSLRFSPDDQLMAVEGAKLNIYSVPDGELYYSPATEVGGAYQIAFTPDSQMLVTGSASTRLNNVPFYLMKGGKGNNLEVWPLFRTNLETQAREALPLHRVELSQKELNQFYLNIAK